MDGIRRVMRAWGLRACVCLSTCVSSLMCAQATANDVPTQQAVRITIPDFEALDRNGDGKLSRSEAGFDRILSAIFADNDTDGDGYLSPTEYSRATGTAPINW